MIWRDRFNVLTIKDGHTYIDGVQLNWINSFSVNTNEVGNAVLKLEMLVESGAMEDPYKHLYERIRKLEHSEACLRVQLDIAKEAKKRKNCSWVWAAVATALITTAAIVALKAIILR